MNLGRTVFAQLIDLLPRRAFELAIQRHRVSGRALTLSVMDQLLCMVFAQLTGRTSLRETVTCLRALGSRCYHLGIRHTPARSTLADANERRDYAIFADTAMSMIAQARAELPVDADLRRLKIKAAFALDSTTIDLCLSLFPWARFKRTKGAIKAHLLLDLLVGIPVFMRISHANTSDISTLDQLLFLPGAFYILDRGYVDFARLYRIHQAGARAHVGEAGEKLGEEPDRLPEGHADQRAEESDQRSPEYDAGEVFMPEQDQAQPRQQRQRYARELSCL